MNESGTPAAGGTPQARRRPLLKKLIRDKYLILMWIPPLLLLLIFHYVPMYGIVIAFQNYHPGQNFFFTDHWVGFDQFVRFFESPFAFRLIKNTVLISVYSIVFGFPVPILFALLLNEVRHSKFKRISQTISYLPHFISTVIIVGMIVNMLSSNGGVITEFIYDLTGQRLNFFLDPQYFKVIFVSSGIWQGFGWGSILYLAAIAGIDPQLYEAAEIDGATRLQRIRFITLPGLLPTISILFILSFAGLFDVSADKVILLYNPAIYETSDVISSYVYRIGLLGAEYSFGTAIGIMNAVVSLLLLLFINTIARKAKLETLW
ncbi:MAG: sugar ABC transporter permease [Paenibacillaceae bacterium]|nr:sugar ABC transporter permease [Paenibacillaceae bacterium]